MTDEVVADAIVRAEAARTKLIESTRDIVAAFVEHNSVEAGELRDLIASVHGALAGSRRVHDAPCGCVPPLAP